MSFKKKLMDILRARAEKRGYHITRTARVDYYQPIPDTTMLKDELWFNKSELMGIDMNIKLQLKFLTNIFPIYVEELNYPREKTEIPYEFYLNNTFFDSIDAAVFHCMVRHFKPKKIIEVGSGFSTYLAAKACILNKEKNGVECDLYAIDPFPNDTIQKGFPGLSALIQKPVENVNVSYFSQLEENDILFIDSSHIVRLGGDVNHLYLEILPRLRKNVLIHSHDIFWPMEYPREWVLNRRWFFTEQYLLQAFLAFNSSFEILWASNYMLVNYLEKLKSTFTSYTLKLPGHTLTYHPSSFWIRRTRAKI